MNDYSITATVLTIITLVNVNVAIAVYIIKTIKYEIKEFINSISK